MIKQGLHTLRKTFPTHCTFWLMSDVGSGSSAAPCSCHDVTGLDINLDFPELGPEAQFGCMARLGSRNMAQDHSPTEKQAPAGQLASFCALGTHKAGCLASESWRSRAGSWYTDLTCHDCHCDQQEPEGGDRPYVTNLEKYSLHALQA